MNLDAECARCGAQICGSIVGDKEKVITLCRNALGVLQEEGVYAFFIYLKWKKDEGGKFIWPKIIDLLKKPEIGILINTINTNGCGFNNDVENALIDKTQNLNILLMMRKLMSKSLTYALYGLRGG